MTRHPLADSRWMWPQSYSWDLHNSYALFRKSFELGELPERAPVFLTADQSCQLYVNGQYVCRGPARGFQSHWPFDEVDVRPWLRPGRNLFALRAHNPGFSNFQYVTQGFAGVLLAAPWAGVVSDASWRSRRQTGVNPAAIPTSLQLFCQEHIDLRLEAPDWMSPAFDDSGWVAPVASHAWNAMPWYSLEPRGIPQLEEELAPLPRVAGIAHGKCAEGWESARDVALNRHAEGLAHQPCDLDPGELLVLASGLGHFTSYLLDYGRTMVGSTGISVLGAEGGEVLDTLHTETINRETLAPDYAPGRGSLMAFGNRMICRPGDQEHTFYHAFGFRYLVLTVRNSTRPLKIRTSLRTAIYPMEAKGAFRSSDPLLERIWQTCAWTQRVCSLDAYVDTPGREQVQWWGDARVQAKNTFFYCGDTRLFRRGIGQIASQTTTNGLTYGHAPTMAHGCILPDFTLVWLTTLWDYYWQTGSLEPFLAHQETIRGALRYFEGQSDPVTGLIGYDERYWLFLDWADLFKRGYSSVYNLGLLIALEKLGALFQRARKTRDAQKCRAWAARLSQSLEKLIRPDGLLCGGFTFEGELVPETSVHAQTLAMLAGFRRDLDGVRLREMLVPFIRGEFVPEHSPSCYWITNVFEALTAAGHGGLVVEFIRRKWEAMAEHGTTWEVFEPKLGDESFSHAWSAHPLFHLIQILGGVRQRGVAWSEIDYQPCFLGDFAQAVVPTPKGEIRTRWERADSQLRLELSLPKGVSATVRLPGQELAVVRGRKNWALALDSRESPALLAAGSP